VHKSEYCRAVENGLVQATYSETPIAPPSSEPAPTPALEHEIDMSFGAIKRLLADHFAR
jgi:hypothetical protein